MFGEIETCNSKGKNLEKWDWRFRYPQVELQECCVGYLCQNPHTDKTSFCQDFVQHQQRAEKGIFIKISASSHKQQVLGNWLCPASTASPIPSLHKKRCAFGKLRALPEHQISSLGFSVCRLWQWEFALPFVLAWKGLKGLPGFCTSLWCSPSCKLVLKWRLLHLGMFAPASVIGKVIVNCAALFGTFSEAVGTVGWSWCCWPPVLGHRFLLSLFSLCCIIFFLSWLSLKKCLLGSLIFCAASVWLTGLCWLLASSYALHPVPALTVSCMSSSIRCLTHFLLPHAQRVFWCVLVPTISKVLVRDHFRFQLLEAQRSFRCAAAGREHCMVTFCLCLL